MKATITSKGQITLPAALRRRLGLKAGDVLEFDEHAPFLKALRPLDRERMSQAIGRGKGRRGGGTSAQWVEELRGPGEP